MWQSLLILAFTAAAFACDSCYGPQDHVVRTRNVYPLAPGQGKLAKRMQPDAQNASYGPSRGPLAWGELNVIHTTDTHGWLEGHILEKNYGADWGDFVSFTKAMRNKADMYGVDMLIVDTGDLHDGAGLSDATSPNGVLSNPIFDNIDYDLLTIGNHELYVSSVAYEHFYNFSRVWGEKYLTSNVQILNQTSNEFQYIGRKYRYFTTPNGLRIMAFGFLFDFTGNSNVSRVYPAATVVQQSWFKAAVAGYPDNCETQVPIDIFVMLGHNPVRWNDSESTFQTYYNAIRTAQPNTPIQVFGGHSHIRDFAVYDEMTTALESGRYCETAGWFSMAGLKSSNYTGATLPAGVPHPTQHAISSNRTNDPNATNVGASLTYSRRYLDWNKVTFEYHATGSQNASAFDYYKGLQVTKNITATRTELHLNQILGCAPQTWCISCAPYGSSENIYSGLVPEALVGGVVNASRANNPRFLVVNSGGIRFDLVQGPFSIDDSYIVSPFADIFVYIPAVPYSVASQLLNLLNTNSAFNGKRKRDLSEDIHSRNLQTSDFSFEPIRRDDCQSPHPDQLLGKRAVASAIKRQSIALTPGYTTTDDLGSDGDDTLHSHIANYVDSIPAFIGANASLTSSLTATSPVDLIFIDYIDSDVLPALALLGATYTMLDIQYYINSSFSTNTYLNVYAQKAWSANITNCPVGVGVGGDAGT
ncbi:hypothetical protein LTR35_016611 [Friedmanniomyces endolithicus]|uniref:Calcineurin-like phosphoesterase domain-containing protein n=1 Tax=Friedmanniomyces endolithicus TaxID=329885 RepID=A0AAN6F9L7_9PEZI|nr:hypothetical protein LTR35_016611 [Friedmanniomyces endolithicus]KAK0273605.1 hypothetical protein LTS00_015728 [Friedmanniomyces endolithicus]KAK0305936.1 hypothetical protein LTR82_016578 [Friedmanniomyces endolithicus]KAK0977628.1 hypothetical protein LTR54_016164 [Friedmanniomyces endolithicus]